MIYGQALRVIIRGPASIKVLKETSRSRMNRFSLQVVPSTLLAFAATAVSQLPVLQLLLLIGLQLYFLLHGKGHFEPDPEGDMEYQQFFTDRLDEIDSLGPRARENTFGLLQEGVFGIEKKQATAEQRRQREFSKIQLQVIQEQAAKEKAEEQESGDGKGDGEGSGEGKGEDGG